MRPFLYKNVTTRAARRKAVEWCVLSLDVVSPSYGLRLTKTNGLRELFQDIFPG